MGMRNIILWSVVYAIEIAGLVYFGEKSNQPPNFELKGLTDLKVVTQKLSDKQKDGEMEFRTVLIAIGGLGLLILLQSLYLVITNCTQGMKKMANRIGYGGNN